MTAQPDNRPQPASLQRLDTLQGHINRQRAISLDHGIRERDARSWDAVQRKHLQHGLAHVQNAHILRSIIEELRFDIDVLVQDLRRFFLAVDREQPRKKSPRR